MGALQSICDGKGVEMNSKLTAKQQRFCEEYPVDLNATQAAIRAGYSERTAYSQGQRLLKHVEIQKIIELGREELSRRTGMSAAWVIDELRKRYNALVEAKDHSGACKPLELIGKHFVAFPNKVEHTGVDGEPLTFDLTGKEACRLAAYFMQRDADADELH